MSNASTTVLVVDDEPRSLEAIRRVLSDEFEVICAKNAAEAEAVLEGELVQILLCDQRMPGESGVTFLKRARERWPETIRLIISGYTDSDDIIDGVNKAGIYRYITKPWNPDELVACMRECADLGGYSIRRARSASRPSRRATCCRRPSPTSGGWNAANTASTGSFMSMEARSRRPYRSRNAPPITMSRC